MSIQDYRAKDRRVLQELKPRLNTTSPYDSKRDDSKPKTGMDQPSKMPPLKPLLPKRKSKKVNYQPVPPSIKLEAALEEAADRHIAHSTSLSLDPAIDDLKVKLDAIRLGKISVSMDRRYDIKPGQTGLVRKGGLVDPEKVPGLGMTAESVMDDMKVDDKRDLRGEQTDTEMDSDMDINTTMELQNEKGMDVDMGNVRVKVDVKEEPIPTQIKPKKSVSFASNAHVRMFIAPPGARREDPSESFGFGSDPRADAMMKAYWNRCGSL